MAVLAGKTAVVTGGTQATISNPFYTPPVALWRTI